MTYSVSILGLAGYQGYIYTTAFWFEYEYLLLRLRLMSTLLPCFRAPKTETFGNTAVPFGFENSGVSL